MTSNDFTFRLQDVNYLGFLESQLRDLHGIAALAYELIQNADDVKGDDGRSQTSWMSFDVTDDALVIKNDGVFRQLDFERLQNIASGGKRDEIDTTGAFGLGFVVVYQVTDSPEIFSNGLHWTINPGAPPEQRILERKIATEGTCFRLPWAFDPRSPVRRTLRIEAIKAADLDKFASTIGQAIETAALFLKQLGTLEVKRNGVSVRRIERIESGDGQLLLRDGAGLTTDWLLFDGNFEAASNRLREKYQWQIEQNRHAAVRLAIPQKGSQEPGRLYAVLPTDTTFPLPFHISADFYPTTDRKRIHFGDGYQAEWNQAAMSCVAALAADHVDELPLPLGPSRFWRLLHAMDYTQQLANQGELPPVFTEFWQALVPTLRSRALLYTSAGEWRTASEVRLLDWRGSATVHTLLQALHIPMVHPDLSAHFDLMRRPEIGTAELSVIDIYDALAQAGLTVPIPLHMAPPFIRGLDTLSDLWKLIDNRLAQIDRYAEREDALSQLKNCPLVLTDDVRLETPANSFRGKPDAKELFPDAAWIHDSISPTGFPGQYVATFGVRQAVDLLRDLPLDQLEERWRLGWLDLPALFRWFESQQIEIFADDPALQHVIRHLPICPVSGELRPLADLFIPGGFEDPLKMASMVDLAAIGGRSQFLQDLGVMELDFDTYVREQLPRVLAQDQDLPSDARQSLQQLLAERLGEMRDDEELQEQLSRLPLIACMDGSFRPAREVYAARDVMRLLGERVHIAETPESSRVRALHEWLGVRDQPAADDIVLTLKAIAKVQEAGKDQPDTGVLDQVVQCWTRLDTLYSGGKLKLDKVLSLAERQAMPNQIGELGRPDELFFKDRQDLADRIGGIGEFLLISEAPYTGIAAAIGVRPFSEVLQFHIVTSSESVEDVYVQNRISERHQLIGRLLVTEFADDSGKFDYESLKTLRVLRAANLSVIYKLPTRAVVLASEPESMTAKFDPTTNTLYLSDDGNAAPWAAVARELAAAFNGGLTAGGLALGIKEVLSAESTRAAASILDELGFA